MGSLSLWQTTGPGTGPGTEVKSEMKIETPSAYISAFFSNAWYLTHSQTPLFTFLMVAIIVGPYPYAR